MKFPDFLRRLCSALVPDPPEVRVPVIFSQLLLPTTMTLLHDPFAVTCTKRLRIFIFFKWPWLRPWLGLFFELIPRLSLIFFNKSEQQSVTLLGTIHILGTNYLTFPLTKLIAWLSVTFQVNLNAEWPRRDTYPVEDSATDGLRAGVGCFDVNLLTRTSGMIAFVTFTLQWTAWRTVSYTNHHRDSSSVKVAVNVHVVCTRWTQYSKVNTAAGNIDSNRFGMANRKPTGFNLVMSTLHSTQLFRSQKKINKDA